MVTLHLFELLHCAFRKNAASRVQAFLKLFRRFVVCDTQFRVGRTELDMPRHSIATGVCYKPFFVPKLPVLPEMRQLSSYAYTPCSYFKFKLNLKFQVQVQVVTHTGTAKLEVALALQCKPEPERHWHRDWQPGLILRLPVTAACQPDSEWQSRWHHASEHSAGSAELSHLPLTGSWQCHCQLSGRTSSASARATGAAVCH